jgi:hypothetical protein
MDHQATPGGAGSFLAWRRQHAVPLGTPCANCETPLEGPWCHACGQAATETHRHAHHLIAETFESLFHADGRLWRTLPKLAMHPAELTRDYLDGKRASQIPPMRLFLVALFILFLAGNWSSQGERIFDVSALSAADQAELAKSGLTHPDIDFDGFGGWGHAAADWLRPRVGLAFAHPDRLIDAMHDKAHDFAFLMLPLSALLLAGIFVFQRRFVLFDHFVFSMHSLAFQGFLISTVILGKMLSPAFGWLLWAAPIHLYVHMRGTYGTGRSGTLLRMAVLFIGSGVGFAILLGALLLVGLQGLRA